MGLFSRFTKKKEQNGVNQEQEVSSAQSSPRRPSFESKLSALSKQSSLAPTKDPDTKDQLSADLSNGLPSPKVGGVPVVLDDVLGGPRSSGKIIPLVDNAVAPKLAVGAGLPEAGSSFGTEKGVHFGGIDRPSFQDGPSFQDSAYSDHMRGVDVLEGSESDSSGEEGGSEREEEGKEEEEREDNESEFGRDEEERFANEGGRFRNDEPDFYGTKEGSEGGYRSEGGRTPERGGDVGLRYHSGPEVSEGEMKGSGPGCHNEVTSPEEGPPSRGGGSGETPWTQGPLEEGELPKSDNEALMLVATWEKEKHKKKPWWKVFGPGAHQKHSGGDSTDNLTPRSGSDSETKSGRDLSPLSDSAALKRKESIFRGRGMAAEKQSQDSERSRSPLWFFRREVMHKQGGGSGSPTTSPPPRGVALELSSPRASNGSALVRDASPLPVEPANPVAPAVLPTVETSVAGLLRREHLRAVPERRELSWVKEWVSKIDPAEAPSDVEPETESVPEPSSPPSWEGNLLLGPDPPELSLNQAPGKPRDAEVPAKAAPNADVVFANSVASEVDLRAATAHLGGRGLKMVPPSLSIFGALKSLDLSRNSIAQIPSGVLPRGLHYLDLSFNKLTAVEGLRELTRLRVLNLHANRIVRIGHGLATCQSLRELHLGGNKIGEVEGLHRLLKLQVLDLSENKLSSTKSLGQLAANYSSLHALNLIGNPVLASVGSDQLRRFMVGLCPQIMYLNKQALKTLSGRDVAMERAVLGKSHAGARGAKREKGHGKSSPVRRGRASTGSVAGPSGKRTSLGRSKSSSRLAAPAVVSHHHHHHHHRSSSQHRHHHSHSGGHHNAHSIPREVRPIDTTENGRPGPPEGLSPSKPPRPPSMIAPQVGAPSQAGGFEFNIPRVYSESAIEPPRQLVKQQSGEF
ncbi:hypothetical protein KFL_004320010 [Klebsormidium nitens]|uniref:Uncharacterized protein n=1 Tax=Klebsormidium nitens TaxID=105231 RepID=A0A1Y1IBY7_KLENI|nr:hypothetical protein KFL_004320010 [Klebsormidium nitens]|eukprot:GAQ88475.1 hypothetical protein KFL_004320010 [Klebsormidium nitens]